MWTRGFTRIELARRHVELLEVSYLLPSIMLVALSVLFSLSFFFPLASKVLLAGLFLYVLTVVVSGALGAGKIGDPRGLLVIPFLIASQHLMYGLGLLRGVGGLKERIPSKGEAQ
jgi:hypothetical protein